jgi:hypothetical protein
MQNYNKNQSLVLIDRNGDFTMSGQKSFRTTLQGEPATPCVGLGCTGRQLCRREQNLKLFV